jgi:hypothetical protein
MIRCIAMPGVISSISSIIPVLFSAPPSRWRSNASHAVRAGEFARVAFSAKVEVAERTIIPNDCKLLAQTDVEQAGYYLTSDSRSRTIYEALRQTSGVTFQFVDIREPVHEVFGFLNLPES